MVSPADRPDGERAFRLLGPIRGFAAAQLADPGQTLSRLERYLLGRPRSRRRGIYVSVLRPGERCATVRCAKRRAQPAPGGGRRGNRRGRA
jgi:hypothetical protein